MKKKTQMIGAILAALLCAASLPVSAAEDLTADGETVLTGRAIPVESTEHKEDTKKTEDNQKKAETETAGKTQKNEEAEKAAETVALSFEDVKEDAWYYNDVKAAVEAGLVHGRSASAYCPDETMTAAEAVKLAASMHQKRADGKVTLENGDPWYKPYADYAKEQGIIGGDYDWDKPVTRADYMAMFARALPGSDYAKINEIPDGSIPDVPEDHPKAAEIYMLYTAGIVQGDEKHLCKPEDSIKRSEVAAILSRMMDADKRIAFTIETASEKKQEIRPYDYVGVWEDAWSQRASLEILPGAEYGQYDATIHWGSSADSAGIWNMTLTFDEATGKMSYKNGTMSLVTFSQTGEETRDEKWADAEGYFLITEKGKMSWSDSREDRSAQFDLNRVVAPGPTADELVEGFFKVIGGIGPGSAGASLRQVKAAEDVMTFAIGHGIWNGDNQTLRENLLTAWESMTEDEQKAFDASFIDVLSMVRDAKADPESYAGQFSDAGAEKIADYFKDPAAMLSWDELTSNTLTMGNSEGE